MEGFDHELAWSNNLKKFLQSFRRLVTDDGEVNYFNHPELSAIYKKITDLERRIREELQRLLNNEYSELIQFNNYDVINDHYVIPIRSDRFNNKIGEIVSRSESGNTLYIQPYSIRDAVYARLEYLVELQNIIYKINLGFHHSIREFYPLLKNVLSYIAYCDQAIAKTKFSLELHLNEPVMTDEIAKFRLEEVFHPLITNPVKNTIEFKGQSLIISGPNTGGKTVTLKSIAISVLFANLGLHVPATDSTIPFFDGVYFLANDNQNLGEGLSSFSAEIKEFTELFRALNGNSLILIDEIFNSTSSDEASSLAVSIFDEILNTSDSIICVSTHHEMLKKILQNNGAFKSCHVGFDFKTNLPTYRLQFGIPGSSLAHNIFLNLFKPMDLAKSLHDKSIQMLDKNKVDYNKLLEDLNNKQTILDQLTQETEAIRTNLLNQKKSFEGELNLKRQALEANVREKADKLFKQIDSLYFEVKHGNISSKRNYDNKVHDLKQELPSNQIGVSPKQHYSDLPTPDSLEIGKKYFSTFLGQTVVLKSLNTKGTEALVAKGNFTVKCPTDSLKQAHKEEDKKVTVSFQRNSEDKIEYDCRGMRLEEFQALIENALPTLLSKQVPYISIIHGHGDGILKKWLRNYLAKSEDYVWSRGANGNDGETVIKLN